ncbi:MAG: ATP-binding protein [Rhizobiaceae bacterium]|nr:ATP-binding protein [Rhizobiaceae bacterium]
MPKGLYARSLIAIIAPMVLLQSVIAFVFMERHWQAVTERLSRAVVADISAIIDVIETYPQDEEFETISRIAREKLNLNATVLPPDPFPPATSKPFFSILDEVLRYEITRQIARPFWIDTVGDSKLLEIRIRLDKPDKVLRIFARRNQAYASNSQIFLVWMVATSLVLIFISILFLRNQIRPIQQLAKAAELFGKGRHTSERFRLRGATEVRQASQAFLQMRDRIERQMEQRTAMLNGVSHDLRTILTRFKLQLALGEETEETRELQNDVEEMQKMLQGYMDFAKGASGEGDEEIATVDVCAALSRHQNEAGLRGKNFVLDCNPEFTIRARPSAFSRLVANVITNAFRHSENISINVRSSDHRLSIVIDDDGPGIPLNRREDVFKPFVRLDEARNQDEGGTGLGLSIARDIAHNHGGDINLHDSPMGGLRVVITLPN